jgi:TolB-like protein/class 3 adenylate cyclase
VERKLAAILAADVVGYTALMERDEKGTHERLKAGRKELFDPEIARHHGRVFKAMGDGLLAEFGSVVDAVECAVALQRGLSERNAAVPEDQRIQVRIGINLGEVIVEGDDRFGEGVNIATRLEQLAEPGGIYVSGKVAKEVEKKLAFGFEPMGEQKVKNIVEPVSIFRIKLDDTPSRRLSPASLRRVWPWAAAISATLLIVASAWFAWHSQAPNESSALDSAVVDQRPSLVVLPFDSLGDDTQQGYVADGITEDLTTELARVPGLFVISRNAAFTYKGKATQPSQLANELGVKYILEGSVRRVGDSLRINAQLIDARNSGHIWAEKFDGTWAEVFTLQDKIVNDIAAALKLRLVQGQYTADLPGGTSNPAAYEELLLGLNAARRQTPDDIAEAVRHYEQALALDPQFGRAAAELAWVYWATTGLAPRTKALGISDADSARKTVEFLQVASANPSASYFQLVATRLARDQRSDEGIAALEKAISLDSSDPWNYEIMSEVMILNGRPAEGSGFLDATMRIDPGWTGNRLFLAAFARFSMEQFQDALAFLGKIDPATSDPWAHVCGLLLQISIYGHLDRPEDAERVKKQIQPLLADQYISEVSGLLARTYWPFKHEADTKRILIGLEKAGVPKVPFGLDARESDRLSGEEIKALLFGHEIRGRQQVSGNALRRTTAIDGATTTTAGNVTDSGTMRVESDTVCIFYPVWGRLCFAGFRNPDGMEDDLNEYLMIHVWDRLDFSVVN